MRLAGERRRQDEADHPWPLLIRPRSAVGWHASCGHYKRVRDRDSRRHEGLVAVPHYPQHHAQVDTAALGLSDGCSSHVGRHG